MESRQIVVIGAGPAGLTAAYELAKQGIRSVVLEKDDVVGGIARTVNYKGYHFDIGGHRFFTKVRAVDEMWQEVLEGNFLHRDRLSRIYYNSKFFYYPLRPLNALRGLGLGNSFLILVSYLVAAISPKGPQDTFEQWVTSRFGKRLYNTFFKTYTEKVWGIPCSEISADWAGQRIKGLSLLSAVKNALLKPKPKSKSETIKTLIDSFDYPKLGPGMMWQAVTRIVEERGSEVRMGVAVEGIRWEKNKVVALEVAGGGKNELVAGTDFISSMPVRELIQKMKPQPPEEVVLAANRLNYRDFLTVALIINQRDLFPDNWIYVHDATVKVGRIQNFKNWSPYMVPDENKTCLGLEYFCFEGDGLWSTPDDQLVRLATEEVARLGLVRAEDVEDGSVVRMPKAYPVYDSTYGEALGVVRKFVASIDNLQLVGRNGMHKYNNQDHSMLTAMLAVKNILGANYDLWQVNVEQEYHEEAVEGDKERDEFAALASTQPRVPKLVVPSPTDAAIIRAFARMDKLAFAIAVGTVSGLGIFLGAWWLILRGGAEVDHSFALLAQYFVGIAPTPRGTLLALLHGFFWGFTWAWLFSYLRNLVLGVTAFVAKKRAEILTFRGFLDQL